MKRKYNKSKKLADVQITPFRNEIISKKTQTGKKINSDKATPRGLLFCMVNSLCPDCGKFDPAWFKKFLDAEKTLVESISLLTSDGKDSDLFGKSLNDLIVICVHCINTAAKYRKALEDFGENPDDIANGPFIED